VKTIQRPVLAGCGRKTGGFWHTQVDDPRSSLEHGYAPAEIAEHLELFGGQQDHKPKKIRTLYFNT
jgi:hypothetical protein